MLFTWSQSNSGWIWTVVFQFVLVEFQLQLGTVHLVQSCIESLGILCGHIKDEYSSWLVAAWWEEGSSSYFWGRFAPPTSPLQISISDSDFVFMLLTFSVQSTQWCESGCFWNLQKSFEYILNNHLQYSYKSVWMTVLGCEQLVRYPNPPVEVTGGMLWVQASWHSPRHRWKKMRDSVLPEEFMSVSFAEAVVCRHVSLFWGFRCASGSGSVWAYRSSGLAVSSSHR